MSRKYLEHTPETYRAAKEEENVTRQEFDELNQRGIRNISELLTVLKSGVAGIRAENKLIRLKESGFDEATALNKEYDRLKIEAEAALKALADFEREKLGISDTSQ